jgi:hypothetical protein
MTGSDGLTNELILTLDDLEDFGTVDALYLERDDEVNSNRPS